MSFLAEDDYPGAARPPAAAWSQRPQPQPWPDADPAYGAPDYGAPAYPEPGYHQPSYDPGYYQPNYEPEYYEPQYYEPEYSEPAPGGAGYGPGEYYRDQDPVPDYRDPGDNFPGQPGPDAYLDDVADLEPPARRPPRDRPSRGGRRPRRGSIGPKGVAGIAVAAASVVGVAVLAPSILTAAENETLTGVVTQSSLESLNFAVAGRVGRVRVRLGQVVRKGQLLAREITPAGALTALRTDRAAIVADKTDLAALIAAGAPTASVTAARAQLAADQAQRTADQAAVVIRAPMAGTVVAVFGRAGASVTAAGLAGAGQQPATQLSALTLASLRGGGRELPVIALRTASQLQVRMLIPAESPAALKVGSAVTLSVPAAGLTRATGVIIELAERPSGAGGGDVAVVQVRGTVPATALTGMQADVHLSS